MQALDERPRGRGAELTLRLEALIRFLCWPCSLTRCAAAHPAVACLSLPRGHPVTEVLGERKERSSKEKMGVSKKVQTVHCTVKKKQRVTPSLFRRRAATREGRDGREAESPRGPGRRVGGAPTAKQTGDRTRATLNDVLITAITLTKARRSAQWASTRRAECRGPRVAACPPQHARGAGWRGPRAGSSCAPG